MGIIDEIASAIQRNPKINRVIVSQHERELLHIEMLDMDPRTGCISETEKKFIVRNTAAKIMIMGRPVEVREC